MTAYSEGCPLFQPQDSGMWQVDNFRRSPDCHLPALVPPSSAPLFTVRPGWSFHSTKPVMTPSRLKLFNTFLLLPSDKTQMPWGFPGGAVVGSLPANAGDMGSSPGLGGSHMPRNGWASEPQLLSLRVWSLCSATREAAIVRGPCTTMKSGPRLPQLEKALARRRRPNTAMNKQINK